MNEQVILSVTRRNGGLEVTTRGTGHDQLAAIEVAAASTWQVMAESRHVPPEMATAAIMARCAARDPCSGHKKRGYEGDRTGPKREMRRNHAREKEPAAGPSSGDGADGL